MQTNPTPSKQSRMFAALVSLTCVQSLAADNLIFKDGSGNIQITPYPVSSEFGNLPWTTAQEAAFTLRKNTILNFSNTTYGTSYGGNTWFENEKRTYPRAMTTYLWAIANSDALKITKARDFLELFDEGPNTGYTDKVDYYATFTLKGQVPKYFYFGKYGRAASNTPDNYLRLVSPTTNNVPTKSSLDRMLTGAKIWLNAGDPMVAAHPEISNPTHASGTYTPDATGVRADPRGTDNMKAMREIAAYLFAREAFLSETNSTLKTTYASVRDLYATRYGEAARAIYRTGISEWDSPNYTGWSIGPHLSMFDFPPETEEQGRKLKRQAKATLDATLAGDALIYWRGGFGGPALRDYGGTTVAMGNDSARMMNFYFGDALVPDTVPVLQNTLHALISRYRPPQAIVGLVARNFARPVEVLSTKPSYANWTLPEIAKPRFFETLYFGNNYQIGSVVSPESPSDYAVGVWDCCTFKIMSFNSTRGVDFFGANTETVDVRGKKNLGDQIAQYRNLALWLRPADGKTFYFMAPDPATAPGGQGTIEQDSGIWFFKFERNWLAMRPINLTWSSQSNGTAVNINEKQQVFTSSATPGGYAGFGLEAGEIGQFVDYAAFKTAVKARTLDLTELSSGSVRLNGAAGSFVKMRYNPVNDLPTVYRNSGTPFDFSSADNHALYQSIGSAPDAAITSAVVTGSDVQLHASALDTGNRGPISLGWKVGLLSILSGTPSAPGYLFEQNCTMEGAVTWNERVATNVDYLGKVRRVDFYADGVLIGQDSDSSDGWGFNWIGASHRSHALTARAVDNDGEVAWSAPFHVTLPEVTTAYDTWGSSFFAKAFTDRDPTVDFDHDGLSNLIEFVLAGDPTANDGPSVKPMIESVSGEHFVVKFKRSDESELAPQPVAVKVQASDALGTWNATDEILIGPNSGDGPNGSSYTVAENEENPDAITVVIPKGSSVRKFVRVLVVR